MAKREWFLYFLRYTGLTQSIVADEADSSLSIVHRYKEGIECNYHVVWSLERYGVPSDCVTTYTNNSGWFENKDLNIKIKRFLDSQYKHIHSRINICGQVNLDCTNCLVNGVYLMSGIFELPPFVEASKKSWLENVIVRRGFTIDSLAEQVGVQSTVIANGIKRTSTFGFKVEIATRIMCILDIPYVWFKLPLDSNGYFLNPYYYEQFKYFIATGIIRHGE